MCHLEVEGSRLFTSGLLEENVLIFKASPVSESDLLCKGRACGWGAGGRQSLFREADLAFRLFAVGHAPETISASKYAFLRDWVTLLFLTPRVKNIRIAF